MKWLHRLVNKHIRKREGNLSPEELDTILSQTIDLDQARFDDAISAVQDYRMAVLFQLAKERSKLDVPDTADAYAQRSQTGNPTGASSK